MIVLELPTQIQAQELYEQLLAAWPDTTVLYNQYNKIGLADGGIIEQLVLPKGTQIDQQAPQALQVSRAWQAEDTVIETNHSQIGGHHFTLIAGPDSIESQVHVLAMAEAVKTAGGTILRGGSFKPRTNPYSFQGRGEVGLKEHRQAADQYGLDMMTEIMDARDFDLIDTYTDIFQVGARNMQNFSLLKRLGEQSKPVGLKRGMAASIDDLLNAAEYLLAAGNPNVFLIERGIRTFDHKYTRNTLDVGAVPVLQTYTHLPILIDPSHAAGVQKFVPALALAGVAAGAQGLMIEIHDQPEKAYVDGAQAITPDQLNRLMRQAKGIRAQLEEN